MKDLEVLREMMEREWQSRSIYLWLIVLTNLYYGLKIIEGADEVQAEWWAVDFAQRMGRMTVEQIREEGLKICDRLIEMQKR